MRRRKRRKVQNTSDMTKRITSASRVIEAPIVAEKVVVVHSCTKETEIGEMCGMLKKVVEKVFGNGQPGLLVTVPELSIKIDNLSETIVGLSTNVSALMKYTAEDTGENRATEKAKLSATQWTAIISSIILSIGAIIVTVILKT
jgi:hypothetical protein